MKTERELYVLELSGFGVIDAVFSEINECVDFSCFDFCGLTKDDITFGYRVWLASRNREGYKLVPVETLEECLSWACCASSESWNDEQRDEIDKHYKVIEKVMIGGGE